MKVQNKHIQDGILVVSAKEQGKLFIISNGIISEIDHVQTPHPSYSDNEGFFFRSGNGRKYGSGNPREHNEAETVQKYIKAVTEELSHIIKEIAPAHIYVIEPEHLKGRIEENLINPSHVPLTVVTHGNYVNHPLKKIASLLNNYTKNESHPAKPSSVAGEKNAKEKRKILQTAMARSSGV